MAFRHWRRSHAKDGATAYRLDWNGLSFVWTGDGRPDDLTCKYAEGADVFVTEMELDTGGLIEKKYGLPAWLYNYTIDTHHTPHYATGYMIKQVNPRVGMVTHFPFEHDLINEAIAGIRAHWDGLFVWGAPDGVIVNVTKDAVWAREGVIPDSTGQNPPPFAKMFPGKVPDKLVVPQPRIPREEQQEKYTRDNEVDPKKYLPEDVYRDPLIKLDDPMELDLKQMMGTQSKKKD